MCNKNIFSAFPLCFFLRKHFQEALDFLVKIGVSNICAKEQRASDKHSQTGPKTKKVEKQISVHGKKEMTPRFKNMDMKKTIQIQNDLILYQEYVSKNELMNDNL